MKKILKYANLFVIATVMMFMGNSVVVAEGCDRYNYSQCRVGLNGPIITSGTVFGNDTNTAAEDLIGKFGIHLRDPQVTTVNKQTHKGNKYSDIGVKIYGDGKEITGATYSAYTDANGSVFHCLDPNFRGNQTLYAQRHSFDSTVSAKSNAYDAAVSEILTKAGGGLQTNLNTSSKEDMNEYWAKNLAIRALYNTFLPIKNEDNNPGDYEKEDELKSTHAVYQATLNAAKVWSEEYASDISALDDLLVKSNNSSNPMNKDIKTEEGYWFEGGAAADAKKYYKQGLEAAKKFLENYTEGDNTEGMGDAIKIGEVTEGEIQTTPTANGSTTTSREISQQIEVPKSGGYIFNGFNVSGDSSKLKSSVKIIINGQEVPNPENYIGKDLKDTGLLTGENNTVEIIGTLEGVENADGSGLGCGDGSNIEYSLDGAIKGAGVANNEYNDYVGTVWYSGDIKDQRYYGMEKAGDGNAENGEPVNTPGKTNLTDACDCDALADACKQAGEGSSACDEYKSGCEIKCDTEFTPMGACCDSSDKLVISTNDEEVDPYEIHGNKTEQIKACFVEQVDDGKQPVDEKNNSYKMKTDSGVADNQFCSVNCREDYIMQLPSAKRVNAGRYFTFRASIQGTKQCFTNTIDREKYKKIIDEQLRKIETAVNTYSLYKKASLAAKNMEKRTVDTGYHLSGGTCGGCPVTDSPVSYVSGAIAENFSYTKVTFIAYMNNDRVDLRKVEEQTLRTTMSKGTEWNPSTASGEHETSCDEDEDGPCCTGCSATYYPNVDEWTASRWKSEILDPIWQQAEKDYNDAIATLEQAVKDYNACSDWETEYNPQPDVTYDYDEEKYHTMASMPVDMYGQMSGGSTSYSYCAIDWKFNQDKVSVNDDYTSCQGGNGFGGKVTDELVYVKCSLSNGDTNCKEDRHTMSSAIYKKSDAEANGSYVPQSLFYNIYPSGEISVEAGDDRVLLEEKLPVAISRQLGIYQYYIKFTNVGEFYENGSQGRFMGNNGIIEDSEYICAYLVNIPEQEFTCDGNEIPTCEGADCITNCIGPNCDDLDCDGNNCVADCIGVGCIYDLDAGTSMIEKTVSLNNLFPNGTSSYNWDESLNDKARTTVSEIQSKGNAIYDEEPILSLTITPSAARRIRDYNNDVIDEGGYSNKTVSCEARNGFEQLACYSSFIDELLAGEYGNIVNDSLIVEDSYRHGDSSGYFTLWNGTIDENNMTGPAWK